MEKLIIPITTISDEQKLLQIRTKTSLLKKRLVKTWTVEQDERLVGLHEQYPKKWNIISQEMKNRNENQCLHRFRRICRLGQNKKIWSPQEDETVLKMIKEVGHNWRAIAEVLGSKTGKQIRERFINKLDPSIRREEWTEEEDMKIIELFTTMGSKWCQISKCLSGRPENRIKNRFYSYIQKNYDFTIKEGHQNEEPVEMNKENSPKTAGVKIILERPAFCLQKQSSSLTMQKRPSSTLKVFGQRQQNVQLEQKLFSLIKEQARPFQTGFENIEQEKENNCNSMKEINDECYFKYEANPNNSDLLFFEDN